MNKSTIVKDSYLELFEIIPKKDLFLFGLDHIITIDPSKAKDNWKELKSRIFTKDSNLYIRNFGRNGKGNPALKKLYKDIFSIEINFDQTNNDLPTRLLQKLTGYRKNKTILNYQVSHVFGNTKNVFCFNAPWNIVFIPKVLDPFTGHEAKGEYVKDFRKLFHNKVYSIFSKEIEDYNKIVRGYYKQITTWLDNPRYISYKNNILKDFIEIDRL